MKRYRSIDPIDAEWDDADLYLLDLIRHCQDGETIEIGCEGLGIHDGAGVVSDSPIPRYSENYSRGYYYSRKYGYSRNWKPKNWKPKWRAPRVEDGHEEWCRRIVLEGDPESDPCLLRREQIRTTIGWFPHSITPGEMHMVACELSDPEWVRVNSEKRNNMSWDEMLWRRTRWLAGYR